MEKVEIDILRQLYEKLEKFFSEVNDLAPYEFILNLRPLIKDLYTALDLPELDIEERQRLNREIFRLNEQIRGQRELIYKLRDGSL